MKRIIILIETPFTFVISFRSLQSWFTSLFSRSQRQANTSLGLLALPAEQKKNGLWCRTFRFFFKSTYIEYLYDIYKKKAIFSTCNIAMCALCCESPRLLLHTIKTMNPWCTWNTLNCHVYLWLPDWLCVCECRTCVCVYVCVCNVPCVSLVWSSNQMIRCGILQKCQHKLAYASNVSLT